MKIANFSIKKPVTVTSMFFLIIIMGLMAYKDLAVDLYPNVSFPIVTIVTVYPGSGPQEIEELVTKPIEKELSTISGIKKVSSTNKEGLSQVTAEFSMDTDIKFAEQQIKDRVSSIRGKLPEGIENPLFRTIDPSDQPVLILSMVADLGPAELYDLADNNIRPLIEQVKQVGFVDVVGGRKREIKVDLDRKKLLEARLSATQVSNQIALSGLSIPAGKIGNNSSEMVIRTSGQYDTPEAIAKTVVSFYGNENAVRVSNVAKVSEGLEEEKTRNYVNGKTSISFMVYRQSGANTVQVANQVKERVESLNKEFSTQIKGFKILVDRDGARPIRANVDDVIETIAIGILLVIIVVYFFLGNMRSTIITGIAIPNSLIGALILMLMMGFSINIMTLLAMSLAVGLLIDDAIVVRENIFRHLEEGMSPLKAAVKGTAEVQGAVIGVSLTILAVFVPIAFIQGIVGQFFKEFGLTVAFIIIISTADALIMAPMMSTYFAGPLHVEPKNFFTRFMRKLVKEFDRFQGWLEKIYDKSITITLKHKKTVLFVSFAIAIGSIIVAKYVDKTFIPPADNGEMEIKLDLPAGATLLAMDAVATKLDKDLRSLSEIAKTVVTVGGQNGEPNEASIFVALVPKKERELNTIDLKEKIRKEILPKYASSNPNILEASGTGGGGSQPFQVSLVGNDLSSIKSVSDALVAELKKSPHLQDVSSSYRSGKPEFQVKINRDRADAYGISTNIVGSELRTQIEGFIPAVLRRNGNEYDIRVRMTDKDRDLESSFREIFVPNINNRLVKLADVAEGVRLEGPSTIQRQNRGRVVTVSGGINPNGNGLAAGMEEVKKIFDSGKIKLPPGTRYMFAGEAESFMELAQNMLIAIAMAVLLIYIVLACLYESFITPITIMLVIPLAACGAIYALAMFGKSIDLYSIIGCILLMGIATKNSILLVEYIQQLEEEGMETTKAIIKACVVRLRPILMTALALIAGMVPLAIGLNEASSQRTSMGVAVIGGTITSTILTLFVIPAVYDYMLKFGSWVNRIAYKVLSKPSKEDLLEIDN